MGTEFFDELGETITRTAKELGERAEVLYESQKIRNKLSGEDRIIDKIMADLGNLIYKRYSNGEAMDEELSALCEEIDQHMQKISEYKEAMANLKGQKICPGCQKAVDKEVAFCPFCGAACPMPEPEEDDGAAAEAGEEDDACGCGDDCCEGAEAGEESCCAGEASEGESCCCKNEASEGENCCCGSEENQGGSCCCGSQEPGEGGDSEAQDEKLDAGEPVADK